jgi:hypothetical protein
LQESVKINKSFEPLAISEPTNKVSSNVKQQEKPKKDKDEYYYVA